MDGDGWVQRVLGGAGGRCTKGNTMGAQYCWSIAEGREEVTGRGASS